MLFAQTIGPGIKHERTGHYRPQTNVVIASNSERSNSPSIMSRATAHAIVPVVADHCDDHPLKRLCPGHRYLSLVVLRMDQRCRETSRRGRRVR